MIKIQFKGDTRTCSACDKTVDGAAFSVVIGAVTFSICRPCASHYDVVMRRARAHIPIKPNKANA